MSDANTEVVLAIAKLVRNTLQARGQNQSEFAATAGIHASLITRLLKPNPPAFARATLDKIVTALAPGDRVAAKRLLDPVQRPANSRPRVFVSSTFLDQAERRRHVLDALDRLGVEAVAMERFAGRSVTPQQNDIELVYTCDLYLGILAYRYGTPAPGETLSHTEIEYEAAKAIGIDRLMFVVDRTAVPMNAEVDTDPLPQRWELQQKLQQFVERAQHEITVPRFQSDADLVNKVWHSMTEWLGQRRLAPQSPPAEQSTDPRREQVSRYRDAMLAEHGTLAMVGFASTVRAPIQTTALYVDLQAAAVDGGIERADDTHSRHKLDPNPDDDAEGSPTARNRRLNMQNALAVAHAAQRPCIVLCGFPGAGKTTFLKRLAVACVQEGGDPFALAADALPVLISLRKLGSGDFDQPLPHLIERSLPNHLRLPDGVDRKQFAEWLAEQDDYPLLLLLDGLDEAPSDADRKRIAERLPEWLQGKERRAVVSSRFVGYTKDVARALAKHALVLELQPFTPPQTAQFITNWYGIVERHHDPVAGAARGETAAQDLIQRLQQPAVQASRVAEFTANPLLLTILCIIHRDSTHLPEHRERLYSELVQVLLENWRRGKQMAVHLTAEQSLKVLMPTANFLHAQPGRTRATATDLLPVIEAPLRRIGWKGTADAFLMAIRDDSGILTGHSGDSYGFLHLGIQEYLTARAIEVELIHRPDQFSQRMQAVAKHYGDAWWREVLLLLLQLPERPFFRELFRQVVDLPKFGTDALLLEDCISEAKEPDAEPFVDFLLRTAKTRPKAGAELADLRRRQIAAVRATQRLEQRLQEDYLGAVRTAFTAHAFGKDPLDQELSSMLGLGKGPRSAAAVARATSKGPAGIELVTIPAGEFDMGSPQGKGEDDERPQRRIRIAQPFQMARTPVTNAQYRAFVEATKHQVPAYWSDRKWNADDQPVVGVSWDDAMAFCKWAGLRLPTEPEWEYACRAGTTTDFWFGDDEQQLEAFGWYYKNSEERTRPVATKPANPWGLHDMHGNVWEWCEDWRGDYRKAPADGTAQRKDPGSGRRVLRGGSWNLNAWACRSAYRFGWPPGVRVNCVGFRPASSAP